MEVLDLKRHARMLAKTLPRRNEGGSPNFRLMYDIMHYMVSYPDAVHHPHEDLIFDKLKGKDLESSSKAQDQVSTR